MQEGIFKLILWASIPIKRYQNMSEYTSGNIYIVTIFEYRINHSEGDKQLTNSLVIETKLTSNILEIFYCYIKGFPFILQSMTKIMGKTSIWTLFCFYSHPPLNNFEKQ